MMDGRVTAAGFAHTTLDTPIGPLLVAATARGIVRIAFESEDFDTVRGALATRLGPPGLPGPAGLDDAIRQLGEYFAGTRTRFDLPLDLTLSGGFQEAVQRELLRIEPGHTRSYAEVAARVGNPRAVRAVGRACATNPLPVVVPCHRVLRADGGLGGYRGGPEAKRALLALEGG